MKCELLHGEPLTQQAKNVFRVLPPGFSRKFSKSQNLYREGSLGIFPSPRGYVEGYNLQRGRSRNFSKYQILHGRGCSSIFSAYSFIFFHISHIFLHISYIFLHIFLIFLHIFPSPISSGGYTQISVLHPPPTEIFSKSRFLGGRG